MYQLITRFGKARSNVARVMFGS